MSYKNRFRDYKDINKTVIKDIYFNALNQNNINKDYIICEICHFHDYSFYNDRICFIQCNNCYKWFHEQCLNLPQNSFSKNIPTFKNGTWCCINCFLQFKLFNSDISIISEYKIGKNKNEYGAEFYLSSSYLNAINDGKDIYLVLYNNLVCQLAELPQSSTVEINSVQIPLSNKLKITHYMAEYNSIVIHLAISFFTDIRCYIVYVNSNTKPQANDMKHFNKEYDLKLLADYFKDNDSTLACYDFHLQLRCPLGLNIIKVPVKGKSCNHVQCFDLDNYYTLNSNIPKWKCPICNKICTINNLCIDDYVNEIIQSVKDVPEDDVDSVSIYIDGKWKLDKSGYNNLLYPFNYMKTKDRCNDKKFINVSIVFNNEKSYYKNCNIMEKGHIPMVFIYLLLE